MVFGYRLLKLLWFSQLKKSVFQWKGWKIFLSGSYQNQKLLKFRELYVIWGIIFRVMLFRKLPGKWVATSQLKINFPRIYLLFGPIHLNPPSLRATSFWTRFSYGHWVFETLGDGISTIKGWLEAYKFMCLEQTRGIVVRYLAQNKLIVWKDSLRTCYYSSIKTCCWGSIWLISLDLGFLHWSPPVWLLSCVFLFCLDPISWSFLILWSLASLLICWSTTPAASVDVYYRV